MTGGSRARKGDGRRASADEIAGGLGDGRAAARVGVEETHVAVRIGGERDGPARPLHPHDGSVAPRPDDGIRQDLVVVLAPDPAPGRGPRRSAPQCGERPRPASSCSRWAIPTTRPWVSETMTSYGVMPASRRGTLAMSM